MVPSLSGIDRIKCMYSAYLEHASDDYLLTSIHEFIVARYLQYDCEAYTELMECLDLFEYGTDTPCDSAFPIHIRRMMEKLWRIQTDC